MRYYIDTEFYENGPEHPTRLISIGIVTEDGREFYAEHGFDWGRCDNQWLHDNVKPHLHQPHCSLQTIAEQIIALVGDDPDPRFYAYFAAYDWVVLCQIFGTMMDLPKGFPMYCRDLKQKMDERGLTEEWKQENCPDPVGEHNALADARWNMALHKAIMEN